MKKREQFFLDTLSLKHELEQVNGHYHCRVCDWYWKHYPQSRCPGIERFAWEEQPAHYLTFTQLRALKLKPDEDQMPVGCYWRSSRKRWRYFYDRCQAVPVRPYRRRK